MIQDSRTALNNRFKIVYNLLEERGAIIKNHRNGRSVGDFAQAILNKPYSHLIAAYLKDNPSRHIKFEEAVKVCEVYGVNKEYLLYGRGKPFSNGHDHSVKLEDSGVRTNVTFYTADAFAGDQIDREASVTEHSEHYRIPGLQGSNYVAFPVKGNSMEPLINSGDIVVCELIESLNEIRNNEIYAVASDGKVWIKYIQQLDRTKGSLHNLNLISANHIEHAPFQHEANTSTRIYKVVSRISTFS